MLDLTNKRCFIIGGGESLYTLSCQGFQLEELIEKEITIGTNKSYMYGKSTYHVVMDNPYFQSDKENLLKQNLVVTAPIGKQNPNLNLTVAESLTKGNPISESFDQGLFYGRSSGYTAMNLAYSLGCRDIYLLGIDLKGLHFHEGYGSEKDARLPKEHQVIESEFRDGIKCLLDKGVRVTSLSPISKLNDLIKFNPSLLTYYGWEPFNGILNKIGREWKDPNVYNKLEEAGLFENSNPKAGGKYFDRASWIDHKIYHILWSLPEYTSYKNQSVLDFSTGGGSMLEVMRFLSHDVQGTDSPKCKYKAMTDSQDLKVSYFDGSLLPYPFENESFDLVTCLHAINFYSCDWKLVIDEFLRIARKTVLVVVNVNDKGQYEQNKQFLDSYCPDGWKVQIKDSTYKWEKL